MKFQQNPLLMEEEAERHVKDLEEKKGKQHFTAQTLQLKFPARLKVTAILIGL